MLRTRPLVALIGVVAAACAGDPTNTEADAPPEGREALVRAVTTVSPITNIVQNIGGDRVQVTGIVPEGTNSHTFEPSPSDARAFAEADVVFMNGLHLEEPTRDLAEANVPAGTPVVSLGERTISPDEYIYDFSFPESGGDPNPHLWTNPPYAKRYAEIVKEELSSIDPTHAGSYARNYDAFSARIDRLDELVRDVTATVPEANRVLLTYHDSFPYFAREFGWTIIGAIQPADFADPSPQEIAGLIDQIRERGIPAIFGSEVFPSPVLQQIADETGARYVDALRDDDLPGEAGDPDHSYLGLMVFDFRTFMGALGGEASMFDSLDVTNVAGEASADYRY